MLNSDQLKKLLKEKKERTTLVQSDDIIDYVKKTYQDAWKLARKWKYGEPRIAFFDKIQASKAKKEIDTLFHLDSELYSDQFDKERQPHFIVDVNTQWMEPSPIKQKTSMTGTKGTYVDSEGTLSDDMEPGKYTEEQIRNMGYIDGGKLLVLKDDKDIFVLLTNNGKAISLRVD